MLSGRLLRGELRSGVKSGLNKKNRRFGLFKLCSSFYTSRGGGIGGPNPPNGALGSPVISSRNLLEKSNFNPRVCFLRLLLHVCTGRRTLNSFRTGAKNSTIQ